MEEGDGGARPTAYKLVEYMSICGKMWKVK